MIHNNQGSRVASFLYRKEIYIERLIDSNQLGCRGRHDHAALASHDPDEWVGERTNSARGALACFFCMHILRIVFALYHITRRVRRRNEGIRGVSAPIRAAQPPQPAGWCRRCSLQAPIAHGEWRATEAPQPHGFHHPQVRSDYRLIVPPGNLVIILLSQ
jgi:hypothetical protein